MSAWPVRQMPPAGPPRLVAGRLGAGLLWLALAGAAGAQMPAPTPMPTPSPSPTPNPPPEFTAPPGSDQVVTSPVYSARLPVDSGQVAQDAVGVFKQTCLASVGNAQGLVDAAINAGLTPYFGGASGDAEMASLLGDTPGQVFALTTSADVLLAVGDNGLCTVWAQRADGPRLKAGFVAAMDALRDRGASVRPTRDRTIQRAGGWRQQLGYDVNSERNSFAADAVTLLTPQPGVQVLRAALQSGSRPMPAATGSANPSLALPAPPAPPTTAPLRPSSPVPTPAPSVSR